MEITETHQKTSITVLSYNKTNNFKKNIYFNFFIFKR
jgi:hypothetical protein